jgi:hypothetical protein
MQRDGIRPSCARRCAFVYYPRRAYPSPAVQAFLTFVSDLASVDPEPFMQWLLARTGGILA